MASQDSLGDRASKGEHSQAPIPRMAQESLPKKTPEYGPLKPNKGT